MTITIAPRQISQKWKNYYMHLATYNNIWQTTQQDWTSDNKIQINQSQSKANEVNHPKYVVLSYSFLLLICFLSIAKAPRLFISLNYRNMRLPQVFSIVPMCLDLRRQCLYKHKIFVLEGRAVSCPRTLWTLWTLWHFSGCVTLSHWPKNPKSSPLLSLKWGFWKN